MWEWQREHSGLLGVGEWRLSFPGKQKLKMEPPRSDSEDSWGACWKQISELTSGVPMWQVWVRPRGLCFHKHYGKLCCSGPQTILRNMAPNEQWSPQESGEKWPTSMAAPYLSGPLIKQPARGLAHGAKNSTVKWERLWNRERHGFYVEWAVA